MSGFTHPVPNAMGRECDFGFISNYNKKDEKTGAGITPLRG
jgi:hypothetical protein